MTTLELSKLDSVYHAILNWMRPAGGATHAVAGYVARDTVLKVHAYFEAFEPLRRPTYDPCGVGYHVTYIAARRLRNSS
jgi:hypothetical protein